jgi:hypothetical protein
MHIDAPEYIDLGEEIYAVLKCRCEALTHDMRGMLFL